MQYSADDYVQNVLYNLNACVWLCSFKPWQLLTATTLINFELIQILMRVDESFGLHDNYIQSTVMQLLFLYDWSIKPAAHKSNLLS
jgi:hypothetical protein